MSDETIRYTIDIDGTPEGPWVATLILVTARGERVALDNYTGATPADALRELAASVDWNEAESDYRTLVLKEGCCSVCGEQIRDDDIWAERGESPRCSDCIHDSERSGGN